MMAITAKAKALSSEAQNSKRLASSTSALVHWFGAYDFFGSSPTFLVQIPSPKVQSSFLPVTSQLGAVPVASRNSSP